MTDEIDRQTGRYTVRTSNLTHAGFDVLTEMQGPDGISHEIARHVVRLQDAAVRQALVALGWTPPADV